MKRVITIIIVCLLAAGSFLSIMILQAPPFTSSWEIEVVDDSTQVGMGSSIAVDSQDNLHICYFDKQQSTLKYALWDGESWNCMYLNEKLRTDDDSVLKIDDNDGLHIITTHGNSPGMIYFKNIDDNWTSYNLSYGAYDISMNLNLDENSIVLFSGYDFYIYLVNETGIGLISGWPESLPPSHLSGGSITVDSEGILHISFQRTISDYESQSEMYSELAYGTYIDGQWTFETFENKTQDLESGRIRRNTHIALDSTGSPHICYYDGTIGAIKHSYKVESEWVTEIVTNGSAYDISMAIDSNDNICLSYFNTSKRDLRYSQNTDNEWYSITLDKGGVVGLESSIAIDSEDGVHISYYDETNEVLKHAFRTEQDIMHLYVAEVIICVALIAWVLWSRKHNTAKV